MALCRRISVRWIYGFFVTASSIASSLPAHAEVLIALANPMTGRYAWFGEQGQRGVALAIDHLNQQGAILGKTAELLVGDDRCNSEIAPALAEKFVAEGVRLVVGHGCSGPALAAAPIYEDAGIIMISPSASNPKLTESGWENVFRVFGRDDLQGSLAGNYLADHWGDREIAIIFDETVYSRGLAEETRSRLHARGVAESLFFGFEVEGFDWSKLVETLQAEGIDVVYFAGRSADVALLARHAADREYKLQIVGSDPLVSEDFWHIAGPAGEGTIFTSGPDPRHFPEARRVVAAFRAQGYEPEGYALYAYAAVQVFAQAAERAGGFETATVIKALRAYEFDTVLGTIRFDGKGDVQGFESFVWYEWTKGDYVPLKEAPRSD